MVNLLAMHHADIQAALTKQGYTHESLLKRLRRVDIKPNMVSRVIRGKARSRQVEARISEVTGIPLQTLWPEAYPAQGIPCSKPGTL